MKIFFIKSLILLICIFGAGYFPLQARQEGGDSTRSSLNVSGYVEIYFSPAFSSKQALRKPAFLYNHTRLNAAALNLVWLKGSFESGKFRANLALMNGTYALENLASEPELLRQILEANAGYRLGNNLWLDAGVFASHIGFESAVGRDCRALSRSIVAENTPYFESGAKISWQKNENLFLSLLLLNNWQRITPPSGLKTPAAGWQIQWKPGSKILLNSSSWFGTVQPENMRKFRIYHNLYCILKPRKTTELTLNFDIGAERKGIGSTGLNWMMSPVVILSQELAAKWKIACHAEWYRDPEGIIVPAFNGFPALLSGYSLNLDYSPIGSLCFRAEARLLRNGNPGFEWRGKLEKNYPMLNIAACAAF